jgi:hypothetical protein
MTTPAIQQAHILAELWMEYRNDPEFADFVEYNDLGLPIAYAVSEGIVELSKRAEDFIGETFALLLKALDIPDDNWSSLDEMLTDAEEKNK